MKKHLKILMAGALVVVPLAATVWVIAWIGGMFSGMGYSLLETLGLAEKFNATYEPYAGVVGVLAVLVMVYLVGLLANFWMFRKVFGLVDRLLSSLPGIKTIYESIRDLLTLFGGDSKNMGHAVLYTPPGLGYRGCRAAGHVRRDSPETLRHRVHKHKKNRRKITGNPSCHSGRSCFG